MILSPHQLGLMLFEQRPFGIGAWMPGVSHPGLGPVETISTTEQDVAAIRS
jgi:hypothetical protein